jgi:hypothetical protein
VGPVLFTSLLRQSLTSLFLPYSSIDTAGYLIGYEDRFDGVLEVAFNSFDRESIPFHRIRHFRNHDGQVRLNSLHRILLYSC